MLTKDLLKYTTRGTRIHPKYIPVSEAKSCELAQELGELYESAVGEKYCDLKKRLEEAFQTGSPLQNGFCKLLDDRCELEEPVGEVEDFRWELIEKAQNLRSEGEALLEMDEFQKEVAAHYGDELVNLRSRLYGDLPDQRIIKSFRSFGGGEALVHRFNCAQVQGLLLRASRLTVVLPDCQLRERRQLFQKLRFHRLLVEVTGQKPLTLELSGPLALFDSAQNYGMRLANFFPYILLFARWQIRAELRMDGKTYSLELDSKRPIVSHYKTLTGYVPQEYQSFLELFNSSSRSQGRWTAQTAEDFFHIGKQSYCFPDFELVSHDGRKVYIELFHRWHQHQLRQRLMSLSGTAADQLLVGVCNTLKIDDKMNQKLKGGDSSGIRLFKFNGFPSPRAILSQLE